MREGIVSAFQQVLSEEPGGRMLRDCNLNV